MIFIRNAIVRTLCFLMIMPPQWALAAEPIVVDGAAAAANQAALATTPSGKAMLNIVAPNAAGVSHNKFTNFNVTTDGLVINNATALATTNLAGVIEANPNFSGAAASLILNEVTSSNRSTLNGVTEIGGQAADYILANPNGITCDGCGFINTPRATLTTGTPTFTANALTGLSVNGGDVVIAGLGLDASKADKFDIVTRATTINAQINAKDLGIHAGRQNFDYAARSGTAKADDGLTKPTFAIDSTALGGMYAGRITLVGTEAGLGVRIAGDMAASTADMVLTANGTLELKSNLSAKTNIQLASTASDVTVDTTVYAGGSVTATANAGTVKVNAGGSLGAAGDVAVTADQVQLGAGGKIVAGLDAGGALTTSGALSLNATTKITAGDGFMGGGASVTLKAPTIDLSRTADDNSEAVRSRGTLKIEGGNVTASNGRIASDGAMTLGGTSSIVLGAGTYESATTIALTGSSVNSAATLIAGTALNATSTTGDIVNSGAITAGTTATLSSAANITNSGTIESQSGTTITAAGTLTNASGAKIKSAQNTTVTTGGTLTNAGSIYAANAATLTAPTISNTGSIAGGTDLDINVASLTNLAGVLHAQNNFTVKGYGGAARAVLFDNASGVVETVVGDISIDADTIKNRKSDFSYTSGQANNKVQAQYHSRSFCQHENESNTCTVWRDWYFSAFTPIGNFSPILGAQGYYPHSYTESSVVSNSNSSLLSSGRNITLSATDVSNKQSTISAVSNIDITAANVSNEAISLYSEFWAGKWWGMWKRVEVLKDDSLIQAGGNLTVTATGGVRNGTEKVYAAPPAQAYNVSSQELTTTPTPSALLDTTKYADLIPGRDALFIASATPKAKFLFETRVDFITVQNYFGSDYFINQLGGVTPEKIATRLGDAYFDTTLVRQAILQETGKRWLDSTVTDDIQQMKALLDGGVQAGRDLQLAFGVSLSAAQIDALTSDIVWYVEEQYQGRTVLVPKVYLASATRAKLDDRGAILAGDNVTVTAATIDNDKSVIKAANDVTLTASGDITSTSAKIKAGNDIALTSTNGSVEVATQVDTFNTGIGTLSTRHETSTVEAGGKLTVAANDNIAVRGAKVSVGGDANLSAGGDVTIGEQQMRRDLNFAEDTIRETTNINSTMDVGGALTVNAGGDLAVRGAQVTAGGDANLQALGNVAIQSTADTFHQVGASGAERLEATNTAATIQSGGALNVTSGGAARVQGSTLTAANDLTLQATGDVVVESAADEANIKVKGYKKLTTTQKSSELTAGGDVTVGSLVGNLSLISSELQAGGDIALNTPNGTLYLGARKDYFEEHISETKSGMGGLMLTSINRGQIDETVVPTLLTANGNIAIVTGDGVIVDYKDTGSLTGSIDQLSQAPGLAWMKNMQARSEAQGDVQWNAIEELHKSWDYRSQGISPVGAAVISLAVGWAVGPAGFVDGGMGASLFGENLAAAGLSSKTAAVVANAGFSSLVSQAATAIVGNGGDIGAALKQLGSMDTIKALATSMVTAGLIEGLGVSDALTSPTTGLDGSALKMTDFANKLKVGIAQASISATVDSVINGAPLGDNLKNGLVNAALTVVSQTAFKEIGDFGVKFGLPEGSLQKVAMHALAGCAIGQVGSGDCTAGAMAAGLQEFAGDAFAGVTKDPAKQAKLAGLIGALAVTLNGGDASAINTAASIGETANAFNRQLHTKEIIAIQEKAKELDGVDSLSAKEWEVRLGRAAQSELDRRLGKDVTPNAQDLKILAELSTLHNADFVASYGETFKFLQRDDHYESSLTFAAGLINPDSKAFYDTIMADWATQTYGGPLPTTVTPSQLALVEATHSIDFGQCGSGFGKCGIFETTDLAKLDPTVTAALNGLSLQAIRRDLSETWGALRVADRDAEASYLSLRKQRAADPASVTQAELDAAYARADAISIARIKAKSAVTQAAIVQGVATHVGVRGGVGETGLDIAVGALNAVDLLSQAALGDKASQDQIVDWAQGLVEVLSNPGDIPPALAASIEAKLTEAQALYEAGDLAGAGEIAGQLQTEMASAVIAGIGTTALTVKGAESLKKIVPENWIQKTQFRNEEIKFTAARSIPEKHDAATTNQRFTDKGKEPPYAPNTEVRSFVTGTDENYVRYYAEGTTSKMDGGWMMLKSDTVGLSPKELQQQFGLPNEPTHMVDVTIPPQTQMETGVAGQIDFKNGSGLLEGGGQQYNIYGEIPDDVWPTLFTNPRKL